MGNPTSDSDACLSRCSLRMSEDRLLRRGRYVPGFARTTRNAGTSFRAFSTALGLLLSMPSAGCVSLVAQVWHPAYRFSERSSWHGLYTGVGQLRSRRFSSKDKSLLTEDPAFVGKRAAEIAIKRTVKYGRLSETIGSTVLFVMPSTSGAARGYWDQSLA